MNSNQKKIVWVVILNWNGWLDTINCLESLLHSDYPHYHLLVCDNGSTDDSVQKIAAWAAKHPALSRFARPFRIIPRQQDDAGCPGDNEGTPLHMIRNQANLGFSAGNNVGIRYALSRGADYIWLLNNDTTVAENTLSLLLQAARREKNCGAVGAAIHCAVDPGRLQIWGGGNLSPLLGIDRLQTHPGKVDYLCGVSLFISHDALAEVGLLDERFFFFWEDVDFSVRLRRAGRTLTVGETALVWHKGSASIGGASLSADRFRISSLIHYFHKHRPRGWWLPSSVHLAGMIFNRLRRRQFDRLIPILQAARQALRVERRLPPQSDQKKDVL